MPVDNRLSPAQAGQLLDDHGSPLFVYDAAHIRHQAGQLLTIDAPYGLTVRYAMKANPHPAILGLLRGLGVRIDASSGYEAAAAMEQGYAAADILLTSQTVPPNLAELIRAGINYTATSLHQLEVFGAAFPGGQVAVRINPGVGSGHSAKTNVGGQSSSFGIWHEYIPQVHDIAERYGLHITRLHTHIGSGTDPAIWREVAMLSLKMVEFFPEVSILNLGGGFKVARLPTEQATDVLAVATAVTTALRQFADQHGRQLRLEIEPGTFLVANAGTLLARVEDIVDTGSQGYTFLKLDTGLNDIMRPSLYGAQHPIAVLNESADETDYVVVGHTCESGDLLSPAPGQPDMLATRRLRTARIGDIVAIGGTGAYCASMAAHGYNSYPSAAEILI